MDESFHTLDVTDVLIGVGLGLLSSIFVEGGNMFLKKYSSRHLSNSKLPWCDSFLLFYAICGIFAISSGIYALYFLSLAIYNCGSAINITLVAGMSWYFLNEKINRYQISCIILLSGAIVVVALTGDRTKPKNMMQTLENVMSGSVYHVVFFVIIVLLEVVTAFFLWKRYTLIKKLNKSAELRRNTQLLMSSRSDGTSESGTLLHSSVLDEKVITNIPGETYIKRVIAILGFSFLCAFNNFWMVISAYISLNQITLALEDKHVVMFGWVFLPVCVFCAVLFVCFIEMNLACFRAIDFLPIYVAIENVTNGIGSIAMLGSTPTQVPVYVLSLAFAFVFALLYTVAIDEKEFFAYAISILPCCFKKVEKLYAPKEKDNDAELIVESKAIKL